MRILLLNQAFYPDVVSSGQHLTDLALGLVERGHRVTVVAGRRAYDNAQVRFARRETWRGLDILRVGCTGLGKRCKWHRAVDFASFLVCCGGRLLALPRHDAVVALTSPPLIACLGALLARRWCSRFFYWVMDLNPDEAIAAGWLREGSPVARALDQLSRFSLRRADGVIALDRFMRERITAKGVTPAKVHVLPPWAHDGEVRYDPVGRARFRRTHGLADKFVVMYSGNHSPCHPLQTLLESARRLHGDASVAFLFVGGGSELPRVRAFAAEHGLGNLRCLPYQPRSDLAASLSAADAHAVVMGDPFVGIVHPCKLYNVLAVSAPVIYVGPTPSHVTEVLEALPDRALFGCAAHGQVDQVVAHLQRIRTLGKRREALRFENWSAPFSRRALLPRLLALIEGGSGAASPTVAGEAAGARTEAEAALTMSS